MSYTRSYHPSRRRIIDIPAASRLWCFGFSRRQIATILSSMHPEEPFSWKSLDRLMWQHRGLFPHRRLSVDL